MASSYLEIFSRIWECASNEWKNNGPTINFLEDFIKDCSRYSVIKKNDVYVTVFLAVVFTLIRYAASNLIFKPISNYFQFVPKDKVKFPESAWKLCFYSSIYSYCAYILFNGTYSFLENPSSIWIGWEPGITIPNDIYSIYVIEAGFYFHSIYGTIYMDKWRRDSVVMILHHVLANSLIIFSFIMRYHNIGIMVLFLHDISDILLESTKIVVCFKSAPGKQQKVASFLVNMGFLLFALSWFYCRLYQYPYKVLLSTGYVSRSILPEAPFYFFFNGMLWLLFLMNVWWFHFVLWLIWRVLNGESREIEDIRELEDKLKTKKKTHVANGDVVKNGVHENNIVHASNQKTKKNKKKADEQLYKEEKNNHYNDKAVPHNRLKKQ